MFAFLHPCGQPRVGQDPDWVDQAQVHSLEQRGKNELQSMSMIATSTSAMRSEQKCHIFHSVKPHEIEWYGAVTR